MKDVFKNKRLMTIAIGVLILAAIGTAVWLTLFNKSARQAYLEAEGRNFKLYAQQLEKAYKAFYEDQKPYMESSYKKRLEFTADIKSDSKAPFGIQNAENILDVLRRCKFILDMNNKPETNQSRTKLSLLVEKAPFLDAQAYTKGNEMGFTVPVLLPDKYFTVSLDRLDQVYDRFAIPLRPKRVVKSVDIAKTVNFSEDKLDGILKEYGTLLSQVLKDKNVRYGDRVTVEIDGEERKGRQIIISLSSEETKTLAKEVVNKIISDEAFLGVTYENYINTVKLFDEGGFFQVHKVLDDLGYLELNEILQKYIENMNVKKPAKDFVKDIEAYMVDADFPDGLEMVLVIDASGKILDRIAKTSVSGKNNKKVLLDLHSGTNAAEADSLANGFADIKVSYDREGVGTQQLGWAVSTDIDADEKKQSKKGRIEINHLRIVNGAEEFAIQAKLDIDSGINEATLKRVSRTNYDISFSGVDPKLIDRFYGELKNDSWRNNKQKTRNSNYSLTMNFDLPTLDLKNTVVRFDLKQEDRLAVNFDLPEPGEQERINLDNISDKDLNKVTEEVLKSFGVFYLQNKPIFDALMGNK